MTEQPPQPIDNAEPKIDNLEQIESDKEHALEKKSLDLTRNLYAEAYVKHKSVFGSRLGRAKDLVKDKTGINLSPSPLEETLSRVRATLKKNNLGVQPKDFDNIKNNTVTQPRPADEMGPFPADAIDRKNEFIRLLTEENKDLSEAEAGALYEVEARNVDYTQAKVVLGKRRLADAKEKFLKEQYSGRTEDQLDAGETKTLATHLQHITAGNIYKEIVIDEYDALQKQRAEHWPPKEQTRLMRVAEWWGRRSRWERLLISAGIFTAASAGATTALTAMGIGAGVINGTAIAASFGRRVVRQLMMPAAIGAAEGIIKATGSREKITAQERALQNEKNIELSRVFTDAEAFDNILSEIESRHEGERRKLDWERFKLDGAKMALITAFGGIAGGISASGTLEKLMPSPEASDVLPESPSKPWLRPNDILRKAHVAAVTGGPENILSDPELIDEPGTVKPTPDQAFKGLKNTQSKTYYIEKPDADLAPGNEAVINKNYYIERPTAGVPVEIETPESFAKNNPDLTIANKGDGAWDIVAKQLKHRILSASPEELKAKFNLTPEDAKDAAKVTRAINRTTLDILNKNGYMANGETVKGLIEGKHFYLDAENKIIEIEKGATYNFQEIHGGRNIIAAEAPINIGPVTNTPNFSEYRPQEIAPDLRTGAEKLADAHLGALPKPAAEIAKDMGYWTRIGQNRLWNASLTNLDQILPGRNGDVMARMHIEEGMSAKEAAAAAKHAMQLKEAIHGLHLNPEEQSMTLRELYERKGAELIRAYDDLEGKKYLNDTVTTHQIEQAAETGKIAKSFAKKLGFESLHEYSVLRTARVNEFLDGIPEKDSVAFENIEKGALAFRQITNWPVLLEKDHIRFARALEYLIAENRIVVRPETRFSDILENPNYVTQIKKAYQAIKLTN